jgi:hypothetical protein
MIVFKTEGKRKVSMSNKNKKGELEKIIDLNLAFSPVTNKFNKLSDFIEDCSKKLGDEFDNWYIGLIRDYIKSNREYSIIKNNIDKLMELTDKYLEICNINFSDYINRSKISKNSIFFDDVEIKKIVQVSNYLKLYCIFSQDTFLQLPSKFHKEIYNKLVSKIANNDIIYKLFKIVSSKTYEYNHTDKYMWDYIKSVYCKTTDMHIMTIFNFIMNNILVTCETTLNPIPYLISVIDESIKWILKNIYKDTIIYSETINTQDVYSVQGKDNLSSYAHNDTISKLLLSAYNRLEDLDIDIDKFKNTVSGLKEMSLFANYITYPILSKVLDIPYRHFLTIPVSNSYLLNILLYSILPESFKDRFPIIKKMLLYYNIEKPILKTTYKIKNLTEFLDTFETFLGFKNKILAYDRYSSIIGKLSRNTYVSFSNEKKVTNFPLAKLESDMIIFYNELFSNKLSDLFKELEDQIDRSI